MSISSVCVFCGAKNTVADDFKKLAYDCGKLIAEKGLRLVYGGSVSGLMKELCDGVHAHGGLVTGVYPKFLNESEPLSDELDELILVEEMFERKKVMVERSDAFIILPGGLGTLDEFFEVLTLKDLHQIDKPIIFVNHNRYWDQLNILIQHIVDNGFAKVETFDEYRFVNTLEEAFVKLGV